MGFTRVTVGPCAAGEGPSQSQFTAGWDEALAAELFPTWMAREYVGESLIDVDEVIRVIDTVLRCGPSASIPSVTVTPRSPQ